MSVTLLMAACSSDSDTAGLTDDNGYVQLRIMTESSRAKVTRSWQDTYAEDKEMMNLWVVVVTDDNGVVKKCYACAPTGTQREDDDVAQLPKGNYTVYSFANISVANVCSLLGITAPATIPTIGATPVAIDVTGTVSNDASKTATINGNNFDPTATNNYDVAGIPMSNKQTITAQDVKKDLIVVRMMAKMQVSITNDTGHEVTVQSLTISDITQNGANNLKLLPSYGATPDYPDSMAATTTTHQDIRPNLSSSATTGDFTVTVGKNIANGATETLTFYINESATPQNAEGLFYLTLKMSNTEYRYALISDNNAHEWNYIARNDYRIIPVILDNYKLELIPYDFPPIGVYPVSVSEIDTENHIYNFTFHDYGHFHLVPKVTNTSTSATVGYNAGSGDYWTLNTDWEGTLKTAATKGGAWLDAAGVVANGFYRNQTDEADADEAGGVPVWYANDGVAGPQWDPSASANYVPFVFGYIAEPATLPVTADRKIYHEFRVKLYVGGVYRRDLTYRYYMTLSQDLMLGARSQGRNHKMRYRYDE